VLKVERLGLGEGTEAGEEQAERGEERSFHGSE
jgi:hypothetical protein